MKCLEFIIDKQGNTKLEAEGYTGTDCQDASLKFLLLGRSPGTTLKEEYWEENKKEEIQEHN